MIPSPSTANAILLVGHPNVGKSVLFHRLTGAYVNVSNYPGTTVEVTRASARFDREAMLLDTPGVLALPSRSDDERATMRALLNESSRCLVQVGDAKNLRRTLTLTALLAELGVPMVLALNMHDEAAARGVMVDIPALSEELGIPVLATVATGGEGIGELTQGMGQAHRAEALLRYDPEIEADIERMAEIGAYACHFACAQGFDPGSFDRIEHGARNRVAWRGAQVQVIVMMAALQRHRIGKTTGFGHLFGRQRAGGQWHAHHLPRLMRGVRRKGDFQFGFMRNRPGGPGQCGFEAIERRGVGHAVRHKDPFAFGQARKCQFCGDANSWP